MVLFLLFSMLASFARFNAEDNSGWGAKEVAAALKEACHERVPTGTDAKELQRAAALEMRFKARAHFRHRTVARV